jgi:hypothetical protein
VKTLSIIKAWRPILGALIFFTLTAAAQASIVIANWSFESTVPTLNNNANFGPLASDFGTGIARGHHANAGTDWSSPAGNGSDHSWSSNNWGTGDYYQFQISTLALSNVSIEWDQTRSATSPAGFVLQWSIDNTTFTDFANYSVLAADGSAALPFWTPATGVTTYHFSYDLSSVTSLNNKAAIYLRLTSLGAATSDNGTVRVDNVNIQVPEAQGPSAPEPSTLALASVAAIGAVFWTAKRRVLRQ